MARNGGGCAGYVTGLEPPARHSAKVAGLIRRRAAMILQQVTDGPEMLRILFDCKSWQDGRVMPHQWTESPHGF
jgi:hypothetical protein